MPEFNFQEIEKKWSKKWEESKVFEAKDDSKKKKFYVLEMYPYPSGSGLHIGHAFNYVIGDIQARFKLMNGFNVLHPMGFDSFGLPAENAAIKNKSHPKKYTEDAIANFIKQQKALGLSYDWNRMVETHKPDYYKWDQWIFLKMFEKGLAFKKNSAVNWCPKCNTVLANEQVKDGKCWRHEDTDVEIKHLDQWFFKITKYADELYEGIDSLKDWPERIKSMQRNWIGKSEGTEIDFEIAGKNNISNVVIVHGSNNNEDEGFEGGRENTRHWHPWLRKKLEEQNILVSGELYPKDWTPNYNEYKKVLEKNKIDKNTILVGHSAGCGFILKYLNQTKKKVKKIILIAPYVQGVSKAKNLSDLNISNFDSGLKNCFDELVIFYDEKDSDYIVDDAKFVHNSLGGKLVEFKNHKHFTKSHMKSKEFPELLNEILGSKKWPIFTTRPDTIFGVTFVVVSAQHPKLMTLVTDEQEKEVKAFLKKLKSVSEKEMAEMEKEGVFTGSYAINPMTKEKVPIWAGNFVVADYGSGMIMAVPAHDQRDFEFAEKYNLPVKVVVQPPRDGYSDYELRYYLNQLGLKTESGDFVFPGEKRERAIDEVIKNTLLGNLCYIGEGDLIHSDNFDGLNNEEAKIHITKFLENKKIGKRTVNFKLRDWLISRQRFWGTPIPIIYCDSCGVVPVPEKDLPVRLPEDIKFTSEKNPLVDDKKFVNVTCPRCGGKARRETDTMDTFVNSSWYFLRYCDAHNSKKIFDSKKAKYWMPVDLYIGGAEHACMHLIYCRFYTKFLRDLGLIDSNEPTYNLFNQGMVHAEDGRKMSKSLGNVVDPLEAIKQYSADTLRIFLVSMASPDKDSAWSKTGIEGMHRFINKFIRFVLDSKKGKSSKRAESKINKAIKEVNDSISTLQYNIAIIKIRQLVDSLVDENEISVADVSKIVQLISPFCPHISEEIWENLGNKSFISLSNWPKLDESKIDNKIEEEEQMIEGLIGDINNVLKIVGEKKKVFVYTLPNEKNVYSDAINQISKRTGLDVSVYAVNDKDKHDPENKAKKAKPKRPSIYLE